MSDVATAPEPPADLAACEELIERGRLAVGVALLTIRDRRLYKESYSTFEAYCQERWGFSRARAYQLIEGAEMIRALSSNARQSPLPQNERQAHELKGLEPDVAAEVMTKAEESGKVTAKSIAEAREQIEQPKLAEPEVEPFAEWSEDEHLLRKQLLDGQTVVINMRNGAHDHLMPWADGVGLFVRVDRRTDWGNPFEIPDDGDRDVVIAKYAKHYLPHKTTLQDRISELRGKALGCWCAPQPCHADVLKRAADL